MSQLSVFLDFSKFSDSEERNKSIETSMGSNSSQIYSIRTKMKIALFGKLSLSLFFLKKWNSKTTNDYSCKKLKVANVTMLLEDKVVVVGKTEIEHKKKSAFTVFFHSRDLSGFGARYKMNFFSNPILHVSCIVFRLGP